MSTEKTHWLQSPNKNYLGHWDLPESKDLNLTIKSAQWEEVKNPITNKTEAKRVIRFKESVKPLICNQTNAQSIINATKVNYMEDSAGLEISLYIANVRVKGEETDCIRIRNEKTVLPELTPDHKSWNGAKKAIQDQDYTIEQIKNKYRLSTENEKLLCSK